MKSVEIATKKNSEREKISVYIYKFPAAVKMLSERESQPKGQLPNILDSNKTAV